MTSIEWTQRPCTKGETWNPVVGCSILSPGCTNCYAMRMARRVQAMAAANGKDTPYAGTTRIVNGKPIWTGNVHAADEATLLKPLSWRAPRTVFVNSMSDLFHESVPDELIDRIFAVMALTPQHTYQVLTKRSARMRAYLTADDGFGRWGYIERQARHLAEVPQGLTLATFGGSNLPNLWLGVSAERQREADERIPDLLATPAAIRFVSAEPLLGPIDFMKSWQIKDGEFRAAMPALDQIIVGGESGPGARPMHPDWARQIRDQCAAAGTAFFFKQWGAWEPVSETRGLGEWGREWMLLDEKGILDIPDERVPLDDEVAVANVGKARAGRLLDGVEHNAFPFTKD